MTQLEYAHKKITIDNEGFILNPEEWDEKSAKAIAQHEGIENLNEEKLEIVKFMRSYYQKFHAFPILNYVCKNIHQPKNCVNEEFIDPMKAWKIAGLPKPSGIHFVSVDDKHKRYIMEECC